MDWCWSLVKAVNMEEPLDSSLLREIDEGDETSANVKVVVERFLAIGVLCTHAMVSVRPTILDAIKMLEDVKFQPIGDILSIPLRNSINVPLKKKLNKKRTQKLNIYG
ncbi:putative receptor-like protein kinase [Camellia lanceoleosa]|uniref:Receptor-like protein kinase n=1 Tax=Camellia lanceoleosa TaxID=1840588 RepID=A0ACC0IP32_9ERIC|nr:putative receptor-like protein kinase [Camellia lanceoleosa]